MQSPNSRFSSVTEMLWFAAIGAKETWESGHCACVNSNRRSALVEVNASLSTKSSDVQRKTDRSM